MRLSCKEGVPRKGPRYQGLHSIRGTLSHKKSCCPSQGPVKGLQALTGCVDLRVNLWAVLLMWMGRKATESKAIMLLP